MKMRSPNASLRFTFVKQTHVRKQKKLNIFKIISRFYDSVFCEKREISWFILRLSNAPNEVIPLALSPRRLILCPPSSPLTSRKHVLRRWLSNGIQSLVRCSLIIGITLVFSFAKFKAKYFISSFPEKKLRKIF